MRAGVDTFLTDKGFDIGAQCIVGDERHGLVKHAAEEQLAAYQGEAKVIDDMAAKWIVWNPL
jgi:hypothetical protein